MPDIMATKPSGRIKISVMSERRFRILSVRLDSMRDTHSRVWLTTELQRFSLLPSPFTLMVSSSIFSGSWSDKITEHDEGDSGSVP